MSAGPDRRLYRALARLVDASTFEHVITPIFADLDHELHHATRTVDRTSACMRCLAALARVWLSGNLGSPLVQRVTVVFGIAVAGMVLVLWSVSTRHFSPPFLVFLGMAIVGPILLRVCHAGRTYRQMFINCVIVSLVMVITLVTYYSASAREFSLERTLGAFAVLSAWATAMCTILALFVSDRSTRNTLGARVGSALLAGTLVWLACLVPSIDRQDVFETRLFVGLWLQALMFASFALVFHIPLLFAASRALHGRWTLALVGGILCISPMLAQDYLAGEFGPDWFFGEYAPKTSAEGLARFARDAWPYCLSTAAVGWSFGRSVKIPHAPDGVLPHDAADPRSL
jgi:hypothetical protein